MKHVSVFLFLLLALAVGRTQAQTVLKAGDVLLLGYSSQDTGDFAFVPLVDLAPGTPLKFTDNGWLATDEFRAGEGGANSLFITLRP